MSPRPTALIYRFKLLPFSETFIRNQAESLQAFQPHYLGLRSTPGIAVNPAHRTIVNQHYDFSGKLREMRFKLFGVLSNFPIQPALLHAHFADDGAMALPLARQLAVPLVVTCHGYEILARPHEFASSTYQRVYRLRKERLKKEASLFISVSDFMTKALLQQGFPAEKIVQHYIGVDTSQFQADASIQREPIVLFTGRLVEKKGCEFLLRSMAVVQRVMPQVKLVVIGDGQLKSHLEDIACRTLQNYDFLGVQPASVVKQWMARAQVFCVPSVTAANGDTETFGMVFAEAQAMGLPVVSFASGGIPEAVAHEKTGLLAPERDWATLAQHILQILRSPELWQKLSHEGPEYVRRNFDLETQTRKLETLYHNQVLKKKALTSI